MSSSGWSDESSEEGVEEGVCLLCDAAAPLPQALAHMADAHGFALDAFLSANALTSPYDRVRAINFIRRAVATRTCFKCSNRCDNNLAEHVRTCPAPFDRAAVRRDDALLRPVLRDDALLFARGDAADSSDDGGDDPTAANVVPEVSDEELRAKAARFFHPRAG